VSVAVASALSGEDRPADDIWGSVLLDVESDHEINILDFRLNRVKTDFPLGAYASSNLRLSCRHTSCLL
jgi:hypothetical protein